MLRLRLSMTTLVIVKITAEPKGHDFFLLACKEIASVVGAPLQ